MVCGEQVWPALNEEHDREGFGLLDADRPGSFRSCERLSFGTYVLPRLSVHPPGLRIDSASIAQNPRWFIPPCRKEQEAPIGREPHTLKRQVS